MCLEAETNGDSLVSPESDSAAVGWALTMHPGLFSAILESSTASGCSTLRMGLDSQECCATLHAFNLTSLWCIYCRRRESCPFLKNLIQVNWIGQDLDIHSPVKNLSFLKIASGTAWTDLSKTVIQWIDAELIVKEYGINLFSFLHSVIHNCPEKLLIGFFCSWVYIQNQY